MHQTISCKIDEHWQHLKPVMLVYHRSLTKLNFTNKHMSTNRMHKDRHIGRSNNVLVCPAWL